MKKQISLCLVLALAFSLAACGGASSSGNSGSSTVDAGTPISDVAEPAPEPTDESTVLRDMSADIAAPNLAGTAAANIGGPVTEQGDWIYYISGRAIYRVRKDTMDFDAAELLYQADHGMLENLNISGKYLYFNNASTSGGGDNICQMDLETGETVILCSGERYYSVFYWDGYLYISGMQESIGGAPKTYFVWRMAAPTQGDAVTEQLYSNTQEYRWPYIVGVDERGVYVRVDSEGLVCIAGGSVQMLVDGSLEDAIIANGTLYIEDEGEVFAVAADGSTSTVYSAGNWRTILSLGADADGRLIIGDDTNVFYADSLELIAERSVSTICTTSNGGIIFTARGVEDNGLYYMDSHGENFTILG